MTIKDTILAQLSIEVEAVELRDKTYHVRTVSVAARDEMFDKFDGAKSNERMAWVVVYTLCDADGVLVFGPDDFPAVCSLDGAKVQALASAGMKANGWTADAVDLEKKG